MKLLVAGCGSIGQRHIRNLNGLGIKDLLAFDVDPRRLEQVRSVSPRTVVSTDIRALLKLGPRAAVIALPTHLHVKYASFAAQAGCHLFIEKPLSHDLAGVDGLCRTVKAKRLISFMGYNFRFHPSLVELKQQLDSGVLGTIIGGRTHFGSYLPDRHPQVDYRKGYGARKSMGGGVILDSLSHHIDYLSFLLGRAEAVLCHAAKRSKLAIDVEDTAEILVRFTGGMVLSVHGDSVQRPYKHTLELIGENGTAVCDLFARTLKVYQPSLRRWTTHRDRRSLNEMYRAQMERFVACVAGRSKSPVDIVEGTRELKTLLKIKQSATQNRWVRL
jgi:predicted dehydrogenase